MGNKDEIVNPSAEDDLLKFLQFYFPWYFSSTGLSPEARLIIERLERISSEPLSYSHTNSLILRSIAGISPGFFKYYFLSKPVNHPYSVEYLPSLDENSISSLSQLEWGVKRLFTDALLFFGDIQLAFKKLSNNTYEELESFYSKELYNPSEMRSRGPSMPFEYIDPNDRYLISEIACKSYDSIGNVSEPAILKILINEYHLKGVEKIRISDIVEAAVKANSENYQLQLSLPFATEEYSNDEISSEEQLRQKVISVMNRFRSAREKALRNTNTYLSLCSELDVYVATSMRNQDDFKKMSSNCKHIFENPHLKPYHLRYFDPTISAAPCHEDKGLIECLMVERAKAVLYFAGIKESWGKDCEASMALTFGKPVIIYCPPTPDGEKRMRFFRDIHPLSRLTRHETGVAVGAMITNDLDIVAKSLEKIFTNAMEYEIVHSMDAYFKLRDKLTKSTVRLCTNYNMLRRIFWDQYGR